MIGAVAGGVVALAGLGVGALVLFGGQTLDTAEAESQISRLTEEQAGLAPTDVRCPADIAVEAGSTFTCTATLDGQSLGFTLRQTDDEGSVDVESDTTFVVLTTVEEMLAQQITDEVGVAVTAGCESEGRSVIVDGIGTPISCTVANAEDPTDVLDVVAQVAADGSVSYESA
ncbi:DUF4333 domain-containing protein [Goekera deserti]|uniref:DUF4333 domain-containing protein n=1 Tax=Goekera deserti TaxID=2497753 RepID=A0A7K3WHE9_9ACTN|nr:DUF4333 domain-containing protein [Goekera deserti]NDI47391.1 DUF4333 domain-containing protein [Goekera deserti]NEL55921.1 DUF4333 domain-containing protein [Goekera deserti]